MAYIGKYTVVYWNGGGGGQILYKVGWLHWPLKCMGHIERVIKNSKGT